MPQTVLSIEKPTPKWATWTFRVVFVLTGVATFVLSSDPGISDDMKLRIAIYLKGLDMLVWGLSRMIGIDMNDLKTEKS